MPAVPFLPPISEYVERIQPIWDNSYITNYGPLLNEFEDELKKYLKLDKLIALSSGTGALDAAVKSLNLKGEVITTSFTFPATTHTIAANNLTPRFADIDSDSLNICPKSIRKLINHRTSAIVGVHCFGRSCDVHAIQEIADEYNLKVIYDAAHCFNIECDCGSILSHGDISIVSLHATKCFHTAEGGLAITNSEKTLAKIRQISNFGFDGNNNILGAGMNYKLSELHAAMGLCMLPYAEKLIEQRKQISDYYVMAIRERLSDFFTVHDCQGSNSTHNWSYFPILVNRSKPFKMRDNIVEYMRLQDISVRKYFYPATNMIAPYNTMNPDPTPIAEQISRRIICLPIHPSMTEETAETVIKSLTNATISA